MVYDEHKGTAVLVKRIANISFISVLLIASMGLIGYVPGLRLLGSVRADYIPMAPSTAISFILLSIVVLAVNSKPPLKYRYVYIIISSIVAIFGFFKFAEYCAGIDVSFEEFIIGETAKLGDIPIGIMSPSTGALFCIAGIAVLMFLIKHLTRKHVNLFGKIFGIIGSIVIVGAFIYILGYLYGTPMLYARGRIVPMAITTAVAFFMLGIGLININGREHFPLKIFIGAETRAKLMRTFLPIVILAIIFEDLLLDRGPLSLGVASYPLMAAVQIVLFSIIIGVVIVHVSKAVSIHIDKSEVARKKAEDEIKKLNAELKDRIEERTKELMVSQSQLVQAEKLSGIGLLSSGIAHELNSPLAGLLALLKLNKKKLDKNSDEYHNTKAMVEACEYMASIVKDLGNFARESKDEFSEINLNDMIKTTLSFAQQQLTKKKKPINISKEFAENLSKIRGNRSQLQQIVLNMITNARDAMPEGGEFIVRTRNSEDGSSAMMEFIDTGIGISEECKGKVFDPFFTTKEQGKGVGLGLSVVHGIVKRHKGKIFIESQPGKGTKFIIIFPKIKQVT